MRYEDLDKHFTAPQKVSPFYEWDIKIPRKLKKKVKKFCGIYYHKHLNNGQRLWWYMDKANPNYKRFLIKEILERCPEYDLGIHNRD